MLEQRYSDNDQSKRDIPSFIEPMPPLISNPFMRPRPQKGTNLLELFEEDSESEEPELVQVYLRLKPHHAPSNLYEIRSDRCLITSVDTATAGHGRRTQHNVSKMYTFSHIFGAQATQKEIFESVVKDNLKKLPDGHNFTLLTYGASGSGKTYTLMGTVASPGLVPRSLEYVFRVVDAAQQPLYKPVDGGSERLNIAQQDFELQWVKKLRQVSAPLREKYRRMSAGLCSDLTMSTMELSNRTRYYVWVSFVEIYNEGIYDLLAADRRNASKLRIREDASGNVYVKGITQAFVRTGEEAYDVMVAGKHNLQVAATGVHAHSSRSHCIFTITMLTETEAGVRSSCVRLCDLAGCERARRTRNTGARMAESRAINSSLHVLERCLHTLRRRQRLLQPACVPYRESKLTRLLGAGLSGARGEAVSMVVTLNPAPEYAHETRHVLQLAAVARDIQVNHTIAETTLESSTQDTTISSGAEVMKLRSDNERLHFELVQAQARNKELSAAMEERQQEAAATMRELVEEAKDMTRQYYEAQLVSLRSEMDDMIEEYESRLSKVVKPAAESGTPSRSLQNKVAQLMTEVAILEEKLTAERLARARAEEEVQHLRACIEERDEKAYEENSSGNNREDVLFLSDSEHDSEEEVDDPCNESLEPTFKREDINKSRLLLQNTIDQNSFHSEHSLNNSARSNENMDDENSVMEKTGDTIKDHNPDDSTKDSVYATGEDDSGSTSKTNDVHDSAANDTRNISDLKLPIIKIEEKRFVSDYNQTYDNQESMEVAPKDDLDDKEISHEMSLKLTEIAPRGTYFVRNSEPDDDVDESIQNTNENKPSSFARGTYFVKEVDRFVIPSVDTKDIEEMPKESLVSPTMEEIMKPPPPKVSETLVNKIIKSIKTSQGRNTSLAQFEELEKAAKFCDETKVDKHSIGPVKILKEKRTYFDENSPKVVEEDLIPIPKIIKEKKTFFDNIDVNIEPPNDKAVEINSEVNNIQIDVARSPSIVKDDITNDFKPSTIQKLLGESFTRQPDIISSVQKVKKLNKKHESVDIFEGLDSPHPIVKTPEKINVVEQARISIEKMVLEQKSASKMQTNAMTNLKRELKMEQLSFAEEMETVPEVPTVEPVENIPVDIAKHMHIGTLSPKEDKAIEKASEVIPATTVTPLVMASDMPEKITESLPEPQLIKTIDIKKEMVNKFNNTFEDLNKTSDQAENNSKPLPDKNEMPKTIDAKQEMPNESIKCNNTIEEFDNLYKDMSASRATEFELLVSQSNITAKEDKLDNVTSTTEEIKYNLRHKSNKEGVKFADKVVKGDEDVESHSKCESKAKPTKRSLRLRRRKNQSDDDQPDTENKLRDIVNLQKEFSDVTMDVPAPVKVVKDIESPEKPSGEEENLPPLGIQSCPSKSVTRSRRKLFTPRAEPLDESLTQAGDSSERVYVPRPSYHRARARRKL